MAKRLLTKDFENIVFETFSMPETDFYNYYLNTVEEHHSQNPNITAQIFEVLKNWVQWHKSKVYSGTIIEVESEDGTTQNIDLNQSWYIDEYGKTIYSNLDETAVSLLPEFGINRQVNRAFFDNQIKILETIQSSIELKQKIEAFEDQLPKFVKETIAEHPQPKGFDFVEIKSRVKLLSCIPYVVENLKTKLEELTKPQFSIDIDKNLSITDKLNHWLRITETNVFEPLQKKFGNDWSLNHKANIEYKGLLTTLYGLNYNVVTPLLIPETYYNEHFENGLKEPEFTYWFLQYNAKQYFEITLKARFLKEKLTSNIAAQFIQAELKRLNDFEAKAEQLLNEGKLEVFDQYTYSEYAKEIEYLRIKAGYYKKHPLANVQSIGNITVVLYAEHIFLKQYLENELQAIQEKEPQQTIPLTDTPHQITNPVAERLFSSDQYKAFLNQIQQNGFYNVSINNQQIKVYTPELMVLFTSKDLSLQNAHTDEKTTLNGRDYLETYAKGFNEGQQHFNSNFAANANTLYGANAEQYVNDIHFNYFHKQHERNKDGWHYYKTSYPLLITHKEISKYGFYAGIISKVEELAAQHPQLFKNFENCQHKTEQPEPQATAKGKQSTKSEFSVLEWATIFYYADETKLLSKERTIIGRIKQFIIENEIETTPNYFKNKYIEAKKRINTTSNYPTNKLETIIPFLKEHYKETITKVQNDITYLQTESPEY
jgi:hypothetical protein